MGTTSTFLKSRVAKPTVGKWSSGFSAVKKYADVKGIPLIAVWSNGDKCGHCINFEKSVMQSAFKKWAASSGCVFWFGYYGDTSKDDKFEGTGFTWVRGGKLTMYPFVRVWWKDGKVDTFKSGDDWTGGTDKGGATFVKKLKSLLKNFDPNAGTKPEPQPEPQPEPTTPTEPTTPAEPDGGCEGGDCDIGTSTQLKEELDALRKEFETVTEGFRKKLDVFEAKLG